MNGAFTIETDLSLLQRFATAGDHAAFAEIIRRYAGMVFATCHRVLRDAARAEDAAQETFYRLMRRPEAVSHSLGAWLHTAATNLAVDSLRSESARQRREHEYAAEIAQAHADAIHEVSHWSELSPKIDQAMAELPESDRLLLIAHFLQGRPQNELAAEAKVSNATMSRRVRDAAGALQQKLRRSGMSLSPLAFIGLLHDHGMQAIPVSLSTELGKMTLFSGIRAVLRTGIISTHPPIAWTAAAVLLISLTFGAVTAWLGDHGSQSAGNPVSFTIQNPANR